MAATPLERTPGCHARLCPSTPTARGLYLGGATRCRPRRGRRRTAWPSSRPPSGKGSSGCGTTSTTGPPAAGNRQYAASPSNAADYGTEIGLGHDRAISQCPFVLRARPRRESVVRGDLRHATTARVVPASLIGPAIAQQRSHGRRAICLPTRHHRCDAQCTVGRKLSQPSPNGPNGRLIAAPESRHGAWRSIDEREAVLRHRCRKSRRHLVHLGSDGSRSAGLHAPSRSD